RFLTCIARAKNQEHGRTTKTTDRASFYKEAFLLEFSKNPALFDGFKRHLRDIAEPHRWNISHFALRVYESANNKYFVAWSYAKGINFLPFQKHLRGDLFMHMQIGIQRLHGAYGYVVLIWMQHPLPFCVIKSVKLAILRIQANNCASAFNDVGIGHGIQYP